MHVGTTKHIIELNGRRYDAQTGKTVPVSSSAGHQSAQGHNQAGSVDGFTSHKPHGPRNVSNIKHHRAVKKSQTLMRSAVKKPSVPSKTSTQKKTVLHTKPTITKYSVPQQRHHRASKTKQSSAIRRFGDISPAKPSDNSNLSTSKKVAQLAVSAVSKPINQSIQASQSAIESALSHTQPKAKKKPLHHKVAHKLKIKPKVVSLGASTMAVVLLVGFFTYQNAPNLSMRVASMRADVQGSLPAYKPSGYSLHGPIRYEPGKIVFEYKSNSDARGFQITEAKSAWDTESLRENFVESLNVSYQTVQNRGKTIYLYDDANATWIDAGIWYTIEGDSKLNTEQLNKLVNSF